MSEHIPSVSASASPYDIPPNISDITDKYRPTYLGSGSEQLVYAIEGHPDIVIKVSLESARECFKWQKQDVNRTIDKYIADESVQTELHVRIESAKERDKELNKFFEQRNVLPQRYIKCKVPITNDIVIERAQGRAESEELLKGVIPDELYVVARVQRVVKEFLNDDKPKGMFSPGYQELLESPDSYLFPPTEIIERNDLSRDEKLKKDFISRAVTYSNVTGRILDLPGTDNVIYTGEGESRSYMLVDAVYPATWQKTLEEFRNFVNDYIVNKSDIPQQMLEKKVYIVLNASNYIFKINTAAATLGAESLRYFDNIRTEDHHIVEELIKNCGVIWQEKKKNKK